MTDQPIDSPIVRPSQASDISAITAIYRHAVAQGTASFELIPPGQQEMASRREDVLAGGYPWLVAEFSGIVVGYAYVCAYHKRPAYRSTVENSIYVRADCQGQGIGRYLMDNLIDEATRRGFRQMVAIIGDSANTPSIRLHEAFGFNHAGILRSVGWKHGRWLDCVMMQRSLGEGDTRVPRHR